MSLRISTSFGCVPGSSPPCAGREPEPSRQSASSLNAGPNRVVPNPSADWVQRFSQAVGGRRGLLDLGQELVVRLGLAQSLQEQFQRLLAVQAGQDPSQLPDDLGLF